MEKVKIYFEDGQLRIRVPEEESVDRQKFFNAIFPIEREWIGKGTYVQYVVKESQWALVIRIAKGNSHCHFVEIAQEVEDYYQYYLQRKREQLEREAVKEQRKREIESANLKQQNGCGLCPHLEYVNAHWQDNGYGEKQYVNGQHFCAYAQEKCRYRWDDVEYAFEMYKEVKAFGAPIDPMVKSWVAPPYPCPGCAYLEKANKAWEEINKEKEWNV